MTKKSLHFYLLLLGILIASFLLRLYNLTSLSPYWEEVALGYDAYSILKTGRDHHGHAWPIVAFESFGDWKPSLYFYAIIPFVQLLGLNVWAVRLPSVLSGVAIVAGVGYLAYWLETERGKKDGRFLALVAMNVTAISPWALIFSRGGWEVNLATALLLWGMIAGFQAVVTNKTAAKSLALLVGTSVLFVLSMYTYHAARVVAPLLGLMLATLYLSNFPKLSFIKIRNLLICGVVALILLTPLIASLGSNATNQRFAETSIFSDLTVIEKSNQLKETTGNTLISRLMYHRYVVFGWEVLQNYLTHFSFNFLFLSGDLNPRHSVQYFGHLYHFEAVLLVSGLYYFWQNKNRYFFFLLAWLFVGIIPAAITQASPHALRILPTLPVWLIIISYGILTLVDAIRPYFKYGVMLIAAVYFIEFTVFWRYYQLIYPKEQAQAWQFGYQELVASLPEQANLEQPIYITREQGRPAMYYWFYTQADPHQVQAESESVPKDQGEMLAFQNLRFVRSVAEVHQFPAVVASSEASFEEVRRAHQTQIKKVIKNPTGETVWVVYEVVQ